MMIKKIIVTVVFVLLSFSASFLFAHGIQVEVEKKSPCILVYARYHGGKALAHAGVTVAYEKEKTTFQQGNSDKNGIFSFYPDKPGLWNVTVDDGMGHLKKKTITLDENFFNIPLKTEKITTDKKGNTPQPKKKTPLPHPFTSNTWCCLLLKLVLGIGLILGVTFIFHRWAKRLGK